MRNWLFVSSLLFAAAAYADVEACPTTGTYQTLLNTDATGGCSLAVAPGIDLVFSDFQFVPAATAGAESISPMQVGYVAEDPTILPMAIPGYGFDFNPGLMVNGTNTVQAIALSFDAMSIGTTISGTPSAIFTDASSGSGLASVMQSIGDPGSTLHIMDTASVTSGATGGSADVTQMENLVLLKQPVSVIPEPPAFSLVGVGALVFIGLKMRALKSGTT
jgi:hypothetical protein